jgi:hypothetical protein
MVYLSLLEKFQRLVVGLSRSPGNGKADGAGSTNSE